MRYYFNSDWLALSESWQWMPVKICVQEMEISLKEGFIIVDIGANTSYPNSYYIFEFLDLKSIGIDTNTMCFWPLELILWSFNYLLTGFWKEIGSLGSCLCWLINGCTHMISQLLWHFCIPWPQINRNRY